MSAAGMKADEVKVFCDAASSFFEQTTGKRAAVRTAYLLDSAEPAMATDYQGLIRLAGEYSGTVSFSAPRGLLSHVLLVLGEGDYSDASHRDIVGEIANQMAGYARRVFGERLQISVPIALARGERRPVDDGALHSVAIPMKWDRYEAFLVVRMTPARAAA